MIHELDVRRPLRQPRSAAEPVFRLTADFLLAARWPLPVFVGGSPKRRVAGIRLTAPGTTWTSGQGPAVQAPPETLLLRLAGRRVPDEELSGHGSAKLGTGRR